MRKKLLALLALLAGITLNAQNALNFDGVDDYVSTTFSGISGNSARTVEAWIRTTANTVPANGGKQIVITDWGATPTGQRFTFNILFNSAIRLEVAGNGVNGTKSVTDGQWHHVVAVYNPSATNTVSLYVDDTLDIAGTPTVPVNTASTGTLSIGRRVDGVNNFDGDIDEVRIWNTARTPAQLAANDSMEFCGNEPGLVAYYKFNQGIAGGSNPGQTSLTDRSGNANNGTLQNFALTGSTSNWVTGPTHLLVTGSVSNTSISLTACNTYLSPAGNTYDSTGTYIDTVAGSQGCDSIIAINLTVKTVDVSVTATKNTLTSNQGGVASYQWLLCTASGYTTLSGNTSPTFTPSDTTASYAVVVSVVGCTDTSDCIRLKNGIGLSENSLQELVLYPNPAKDLVNIKFPGTTTSATVNIYTPAGQLVKRVANVTGNEPNLNVAHLPKGLYVIKLEVDGSGFSSTLLLQ